MRHHCRFSIHTNKNLGVSEARVVVVQSFSQGPGMKIQVQKNVQLVLKIIFMNIFKLAEMKTSVSMGFMSRWSKIKHLAANGKKIVSLRASNIFDLSLSVKCKFCLVNINGP